MRADLSDVSFNKPGYLPGKVMECANCGAIFKSFDSTIAQLYDDKYYEEFKDLDAYVQDKFYNQIVDLVKQKTHLPQGTRQYALLDIGAGPGGILAAFTKQGFDCQGVEINKDLAANLQAKGYEVFNGTIENFETEALFDVITMTDVIEHLEDPKAVLQKVNRLLKPGGYVVVYTPNHASLLVKISFLLSSLFKFNALRDEIFASTHTVFFIPKTLTKILADAGFTVTYRRFGVYDFDKPGMKIPLLIRLGITTTDAIGYLFGLKGFRMTYLGKKA